MLVRSMFGTARAANEALSIVQDVAAMKALLLGQGVPGLRYLQNSTYNSSDYNRIVGLMSNSITQVTIHHQGLYHGKVVDCASVFVNRHCIIFC
jgi:hypothetical protein